jgi:hypothetical protein
MLISEYSAVFKPSDNIPPLVVSIAVFASILLFLISIELN